MRDAARARLWPDGLSDISVFPVVHGPVPDDGGGEEARLKPKDDSRKRKRRGDGGPRRVPGPGPRRKGGARHEERHAL